MAAAGRASASSSLCATRVGLLGRSRVMFSGRQFCPRRSNCCVAFISHLFIATTGPIPEAFLFPRQTGLNPQDAWGICQKNVEQTSPCRYNDTVNAVQDRQRSRRATSASCRGIRDGQGGPDSDDHLYGASACRRMDRRRHPRELGSVPWFTVSALIKERLADPRTKVWIE
jgi:hypothetical protein